MTTPEPPSGTVLWPFAGLRVVSGDLELRYLDDGLLFPLARLAGEGVHAEDQMPFPYPWTRGTPAEVGRSVLAFQWRVRAGLLDGPFRLELAVLHRGEPVGIQGCSGSDVAITREAKTGSWLGRRYQGQGIGTHMRWMVLHLLFEGLGVTTATTSADADNAASNGVTRHIGYEPNGVDLRARDGKPAPGNLYRLEREDWRRKPDRPHVELYGVEPVRRFLGLDGPAGPDAQAAGSAREPTE